MTIFINRFKGKKLKTNTFLFEKYVRRKAVTKKKFHIFSTF